MNKKLFKKILGRIDLFALVGVLVGVVLLGQPISKIVFMIGFPLILFCTALHMVLDHYV